MKNGILLIDKEAGMTSFDVIHQLRRNLGIKKIGHSGTLDPNVTGLLVVAVGNATKSLKYLDVFDKTYIGKLELGIKTNTGDIWGEVIKMDKLPSFDIDFLKEKAALIVGNQQQRVPMTSAKKYKGKKLYEYHRAGIQIPTQYHQVEIYSFEILDVTEKEIEFKTKVSNGTYIRTLVEDYAKILGTYGVMTSLERIQVGKFNLKDAVKLHDIEKNNYQLTSIKEHLWMPVVELGNHSFKIKNGQAIRFQSDEEYLCFSSENYLAIYQKTEDNIYKSVRGLW